LAEDFGNPPNQPYANIALRHRIGALALDVEFELSQPWTILFGPSGSGKTTILNAIAGLLKPGFGRIRIGRGAEEKTLLDTSRGLWVSTHLRGTPLASQTPALFPHLTVEQNLAYAASSGAIDAELFGIEGLLSRFPAQLSGGEAQRVNLARAAHCPASRLLMLDEPFTGLESSLREALADRLLAWQQRTGVPVVSVTHDVAEAFRLNAEVIHLDRGKTIAQGPATEVLEGERRRLLTQLKGD
jgi:molybdate transport system ATP-binding protein